MITLRKLAQGAVVAVLAHLALTAPVHAQENWPDKPVKFILSQPPGSGPDVVARLMGEHLSKAIGQSVVVDNRPGGQNVIGAQAAARSAPDGYTFYFATTAALVTNKHLFKSLPYDAQKDFAPVAFIANSAFAVLVHADSPIKSMQDLIAKSKAEPGKLTLANEGPRSFGGIIARLINARAEMKANLISYASVGVAVQDVTGGHAEAVVADLASTAQLVRQGRLKLLAVTSAKRADGWEQVPALAELLPGFEMVGWFAIVAPVGTPAATLRRVNAEIDKLIRDPEIVQRIRTIGPVPNPMGGPEQLGAFLDQEHARWESVAKEIGLLPE